MKKQGKDLHSVHTKETGLLRIFVLPTERKKRTGILANLTAKPVFQEIIDEAHRFGITSAIAHQGAYGFAGDEGVQATSREYPNVKMSMCVDLIGERDLLESFCKTHAELIKGKLVVYKHIEHWDVRSNELTEQELTNEELLQRSDIL